MLRNHLSYDDKKSEKEFLFFSATQKKNIYHLHLHLDEWDNIQDILTLTGWTFKGNINDWAGQRLIVGNYCMSLLA